VKLAIRKKSGGRNYSSRKIRGKREMGNAVPVGYRETYCPTKEGKPESGERHAGTKTQQGNERGACPPRPSLRGRKGRLRRKEKKSLKDMAGGSTTAGGERASLEDKTRLREERRQKKGGPGVSTGEEEPCFSTWSASTAESKGRKGRVDVARQHDKGGRKPIVREVQKNSRSPKNKNHNSFTTKEKKR